MRKMPIYLEFSEIFAIFVSVLIFDLILHSNTSPPPRQVFRSGQPSTEVGVGAYFFDFSHFFRKLFAN